MWAIDRNRAERQRLIGPRTLPVDATGLRYGGSGSTVRASFRDLERMKGWISSAAAPSSPAGRAADSVARPRAWMRHCTDAGCAVLIVD